MPLQLLDMNPNFCRPEDLIVTNLLVPPICIRPSVVTQGSSGSNEDDLTVKLGEIVLTNNTIRIAMEKGGGALHILEDWMMLQAHVTTYFNADNMAAQQIIAGNRNQKPKPMRRLIAVQLRFALLLTFFFQLLSATERQTRAFSRKFIWLNFFFQF